MSNNDINLDWNSGVPGQEGLYFVAVKYGEGAGVFDFLTWSGSAWVDPPQGEVIAHVDIQSLKNKLNVVWPESDAGVQNNYTPVAPVGDDPWHES